jgi:hypothetical protein
MVTMPRRGWSIFAACGPFLLLLSCGAPSLTFNDEGNPNLDGGSDSTISPGSSDAAPDVPLGCANLQQDGVETDVDCGGQSCPGCATGLKCKGDTDCVSAYCNDGMCARASCVDKVKNLNETDVDCGGTDCPPCAVGKSCKAFSDCQQQSCTAGKCQPQTCDDHFQGPGETDVDCGGTSCAPCAVGKKCLALGDCVTSVCGPDSLCAAPSCGDGVQNGEETGKDCGGTSCPKCADGLGCAVGTDCASGTCTDHVCEMVSCNDKILNGSESDIDCGGSCTTKCLPNAVCKADTDCTSGNCATTCQACPRAMVSVPVPSPSTSKYCIDATEVTVAAYSAFLASNPSIAILPASCSTKTSFVPGAPLDMSRANYPVTQVDWCDAWGFCAAAGKHLCGRIGGGNTLVGFETGDARKSEWYSACSKGGAQTYPYPGQYVGTRCVDHNIQNLRQVATFTGCVGGYPGLFDMSGNVAEWENDCSFNNGQDYCGARGGSYNDQSTTLTCTTVSSRLRTSRSLSVGFRCCF